jgi:hypothetical protein
MLICACQKHAQNSGAIRRAAGFPERATVSTKKYERLARTRPDLLIGIASKYWESESETHIDGFF